MRFRLRQLAFALLAIVISLTARGGFAFPAVVETPLDLGAGKQSYAMVGPHASVYRHCGDELHVREIDALARAGRFERLSANGLSYGYSDCDYWLRIRIRNTAATHRDWLVVLENSRVDRFELHELGADGAVVQRSGSLVRMSERPVQSRYPALLLGPISAEPHTLYLRIKTTDVASFPLRVIERNAYVQAEHEWHLVLGLYFGMLLFAAFLNMFMFLCMGERTHLLYALLILCYGLFQIALNGIDIEYFWPEHPRWNMTAIPLFGGLSLVSGGFFCRAFLGTRCARWFAFAVSVAVGSGAVVAALAWLGSTTSAGILCSVVAPIGVACLIVMSIVATVRGVPFAGYFLLAWSMQLFGIALMTSRNFAIFPTTFLMTYANQIGSALFVLCLCVALIRRFDLLQREKLLAQRTAAEAKLQALQAKIKPHFLFNTLNTINGLIVEAPERAAGVTVRLSKLFRYMVEVTRGHHVLLGEELTIVRSYLEIEQARFGERLRFCIQTDGAVEDLYVPGLMLQPLVENSVRHGICPKREGGRVTVSARLEGDSCLLSVEDDGIGMDLDAAHAGHGLASVRDRLELVYGNEFEMKLTSRSGVRIDIRLPTRRWHRATCIGSRRRSDCSSTPGPIASFSR